jgi:two-component system chemotaxis response regulator CheB
MLPPEASDTRIHIMIVDDSAIVRGVLLRHLSAVPQFNVVASLANGEMAVSAIRHQPVDVVILDVEMPVMDGLTALPKLIEAAPEVCVIMASTLTARNAEISLRALEMGAADYVPKPSAKEDKHAQEEFFRELIAKIHALAPGRGRKSPMSAPASASTPKISVAPVSVCASGPPPRWLLPSVRPKALAIASSTGGPQALMEIFRPLRGQLTEVPIFITQHMPKTFTRILSEHLAQACGHECHEAVQGERAAGGTIYIAPGDFHMVPYQEGGEIRIGLNQEAEVNYCRPAADPMIEALVSLYGKHLLLLVLTGMGHDGLGGAKALHAAGGAVVAQDRETSVVWGMPKAVVDEQLCRAVLPLSGIAPYLIRAFCGEGGNDPV